MSAATFEDARRIVAARFGPQHRPSQGTFAVAEYGYESAAVWVVFYGAAHTLAAQTLDEAEVDPLVTFVFRDTGEVVQEPYIEVMNELEQMTPIGMWPGRVA